MSMDQACPGCGVPPMQEHKLGCDVERCRLCGLQLFTCDCHHTLGQWYPGRVKVLGGRLPWTGEWPGVAECEKYGFWYKLDRMSRRDRPRWVSCPPGPEASPDLNRLYRECVWNAEQGLWVPRG